MVTYNPTLKKFLTVAQSRTNDGQKDIRIILDTETNVFYSLDDNGNFKEIAINGSIIRDYFEDYTYIDVVSRQIISVTVNSGTFQVGDSISGLSSNKTFIINKIINTGDGGDLLVLQGSFQTLSIGETIQNLSRAGQATLDVSPNPIILPDTILLVFEPSTGNVISFCIVEERNGITYKVSIDPNLTGFTSDYILTTPSFSNAIGIFSSTSPYNEEQNISITLENSDNFADKGIKGSGSSIKDNLRNVIVGIINENGLPSGVISYSSISKTIDVKVYTAGVNVTINDGNKTTELTMNLDELQFTLGDYVFGMVQEGIYYGNTETPTIFVLPTNPPNVGDVVKVLQESQPGIFNLVFSGI